MATQTSLQKILLVDDDIDDCGFFEEQLKEIAPAVKLLCINETTHLLLHVSELKPDLIFLDVDMPRKNGFDCLTELKKDPALSPIPIVIYSSSFLPRDIERAYRQGASLYVTKPAGLDDIKATVKAIIELNWLQPDKIRDAYFINQKFTPFKLNV